MAEREFLNNEKQADIERSSEDIRRNIAKQKENISQKVDQINERIKEKLDWREYVKDSPCLALGVAAGLGFIGSRVLIPRTSPMERLMDSIAGDVRGSLNGLSAGPGLIKLTLLGIATKAAAGWIKNATATSIEVAAAPPPGPERRKGIAGPPLGPERRKGVVQPFVRPSAGY